MIFGRLSRPSPAMCVALLALVMSTTGTTIAATTLLPRDSVGAAQLRAGSVGSAEVANRSITLPDLAYSTIGSLRRPAGGAGGALGGTYPSPTLAPGAVTAAALADGIVTGPKLADGSIGGSKIMSGSIGEEDLVAEEAWRVVGGPGEIPLVSGWGSSGFDLYHQASYRKDRFGTVHLRGSLWSSVNTGAGYMFHLPAGYRPLKHRMFPVATAGSVIGIVDVEQGGGVWVNTAANEARISLDGISFEAEL